jgi:hypothetical protein
LLPAFAFVLQRLWRKQPHNAGKKTTQKPQITIKAKMAIDSVNLK